VEWILGRNGSGFGTPCRLGGGLLWALRIRVCGVL
jgi:hypothetical protein